MERIAPGPGQESVWDYPRPPKLIPFDGHITIADVADTHRALKLMETSSPPTYYIPPADVSAQLRRAAGSSHCEWKGRATYYDVVLPDGVAHKAAWAYHDPNPDYRALKDHLAFYPQHLDCRINNERVQGQEGGFYGGWITANIVGPFKGAAGTLGW